MKENGWAITVQGNGSTAEHRTAEQAAPGSTDPVWPPGEYLAVGRGSRCVKCWNHFVSLKKGKKLRTFSFALKLQEVYFEKYTLYMKIPGGKTKKCVVATDHEQQEWNMGIPSHSFMPKLNRPKYSWCCSKLIRTKSCGLPSLLSYTCFDSLRRQRKNPFQHPKYKTKGCDQNLYRQKVLCSCFLFMYLHAVKTNLLTFCYTFLVLCHLTLLHHSCFRPKYCQGSQEDSHT